MRSTRTDGVPERTRAGGLLIAVVLLLGPWGAESRAETVYRWTDADGIVHYGSAPPPGAEAERIDLTTPDPGPSAPTGEGASATDGGESAAADATTDDATAEPAAAQPQPLTAEQCEQLEHNRMLLESQPGGLLIEGEDGEPRRMPNDERERRLEETEAMLDEHC